MAKVYDLVIKTSEYTDNQNQVKGKYTKLGVVMSGQDGGQFMLLEPCVDIAGCLMLQNIMASAKGQQERDSVMVSMFEPQQQGQQPQGNNNQPMGGQGQPQQQPQGQQPNNQPQGNAGNYQRPNPNGQGRY